MESFKKHLPTILGICRALLLYACVLLMHGACAFVARSASYLWLHALLLILIYHSIVRIFAETNRSLRDVAFLYREETDPFSRSASEILALILKSPVYRLELAVLLALPLLLPPEVGFGAFTAPLLTVGLSRIAAKAILLAIAYPILFGMGLLSHYYAFLWCLSAPPKRDKLWRTLALKLLGLFIIYLVGSLAIFFFIPVFISIYFLFAALFRLYWWLPLLVVAAPFLLFWGFALLRAARIRHRFLKNLTALCRSIGATLSPISRPYRSLFRTDHTPNFAIEHQGKRYICKLFSATRRHNPLFFSEHGVVQCLHSFRFRRVEYFRYTTQYDFSFEGDGLKILIVNPVSKELYAGHTGFYRDIDTGERVGEYKIFTATGFLGALSRDVLDR